MDATFSGYFPFFKRLMMKALPLFFVLSLPIKIKGLPQRSLIFPPPPFFSKRTVQHGHRFAADLPPPPPSLFLLFSPFPLYSIGGRRDSRAQKLMSFYPFLSFPFFQSLSGTFRDLTSPFFLLSVFSLSPTSTGRRKQIEGPLRVDRGVPLLLA